MREDGQPEKRPRIGSARFSRPQMGRPLCPHEQVVLVNLVRCLPSMGQMGSSRGQAHALTSTDYGDVCCNARQKTHWFARLARVSW